VAKISSELKATTNIIWISLLQEITKAVSGEVVSSSLNNDSIFAFKSMYKRMKIMLVFYKHCQF
jgi:hypothetical protein